MGAGARHWRHQNTVAPLISPKATGSNSDGIMRLRYFNSWTEVVLKSIAFGLRAVLDARGSTDEFRGPNCAELRGQTFHDTAKAPTPISRTPTKCGKVTGRCSRPIMPK